MSAHEPLEDSSSGGRSPRADSLYGELIREDLYEERARKASLERRALVLLALSGVTVLALLVFAVVIPGRLSADVARQVLLLTSLVLCLVATVSGVAAVWPRQYIEAAPRDMERLTESRFWVGRGEIAGKRVAEVRLKVLARARTINERKSVYLRLSFAAQTLALVAIGTLVVILAL
jgi:hypothetical protein